METKTELQQKLSRLNAYTGKQLLDLTDEKFQEIYTDPQLRNAVAFAHECWSASPGSKFLHFKALMYPIEYIVNAKQKELANLERKNAKIKAIQDNAGKLVFVSMGGSYEPRYDGDPGNHRIRSEFLSYNGSRYFIEICRQNTPPGYCITHAIDRTKQEDLNDDHKKQHLFFNFKRLEHSKDKLKSFTLADILQFINEHFECNFKEILVDRHTLSCNDFMSISPLLPPW